ncbi:YbaL family putative K(+) efflux transporter [Paeniroseomonas aquatica]|uniref:YbaL family putative K(+) efflux transporter n=2 Tax=Paeniroseomonas aquatica TaxID=373043 RepID=A0ABT8A0N9_9PROT|nr:YbaL family putative K(+) efflux transporter [Paeniroseomonas aquatica]MDN3563297.1 YbaL family putative K(+) efflux transporter [Paeniroseomonas aquatica]
MPQHHPQLIATLAVGLGLAFLFGVVAHRLRVSPLVGYLLAGVAVGPFTPGIVANQEMANQLAEIGVILLMFAVGLHFSLKDLTAVWRIAIPGSLGRMAGATLMGMGLAWMFGWGIGAGLVFGLALSVASTVVLVRALQERRIADTERGHIAMGWLIVEDLATILVLVLLPSLAPALKGDAGASAGDLVVTILITFAKVGGFIAIMLVGGRRVIPWIMHHAAHTGSRELFRLAVYAVALGVAFGASELFGVSFALGAFLAGMVMAESPLSQRAAEEALPLRDAFAVLFFVSVGMLFNPGILLVAPFAVLAVLAIILFGKSAVAYGILRVSGQDHGTALSISASLAQIGEFSFILVELGAAFGLLPPEGRDLVLAGAILSILLNPVLFGLAERWRTATSRPVLPPTTPAQMPEPPPPRIPISVTALGDHDVVIGYGRVGSLVTAGLRAVGRPVLVLGDAEDSVMAARAIGVETVQGNAADPKVLAAANLPAARRLFVTVPEMFEAGQVVQQARAANPALEILARAHSEAGVSHLRRLGADRVIMAEWEVAHRMLDDTAGAQVMLHPGLGPLRPTPPGV